MVRAGLAAAASALVLFASASPVRAAPYQLFVPNERSGDLTISVLDSQTYAVLATIKVGARPWGIVLSRMANTSSRPTGPSNDVSVVDLRAAAF